MAISGTILSRSRLCDTRESERDNDLTQEQSGMALLFKTCAWCACKALDSIPITNNVIPSFYTRSIQNMFPPEASSGLESDSGKFLKKTLLVISVACAVGLIAYRIWNPWSYSIEQGIGAALSATILLAANLMKPSMTPVPYEHTDTFPAEHFVLPSYFDKSIKEKIRPALLTAFEQEIIRFAHKQTPENASKAFERLSCLEISNSLVGNPEDEEKAVKALASAYVILIEKAQDDMPLTPEITENLLPLTIVSKTDGNLSEDCINAFLTETVKEKLEKITHAKVHARKTPIPKVIKMLRSFKSNAQISIEIDLDISKKPLIAYHQLNNLLKESNVSSVNVSISADENQDPGVIRLLDRLTQNNKLRQATIDISADFGAALSDDVTIPLMRLISNRKVQQMDLRAHPTPTVLDDDQIEILRKVGKLRLSRSEDPTPKVCLRNFTPNSERIAPINGIQFAK